MLSDFYFWIKALHIMAVISWMAGLFYLPRLFVYHVERSEGAKMDAVFQTMEEKLLRVIMNPAMIVAWVTGLMMVSIPGVVDWSSVWPWSKFIGLIGMTWFHMWCARRRRIFAEGANSLTGRNYRMMNEVPTVMMVVIVLSVVVKF
ncbi:protoporphyrinogen oxidase HemJ [Roseinatronobacter bogoriensis]|uniref:protoporphyrinogen oxidase HemJ n=1 Tax=Roseinatronobacter bogoriensis TaxID=119542 RepID=UPI000B309AE6|nr:MULTISPECIES: protoporphyrinogen oxidase HemJ [Rhodobaca]MBB4209458.1 putative membrane protein [Rhodobaca bogoriensis DSM 18756]TDW35176.1 putative membrane protein [Rhodobaca barguzinensis]TDY66814.1 putative membrane protein [Rhodobaca bogoriensis DSM 18756]